MNASQPAVAARHTRQAAGCLSPRAQRLEEVFAACFEHSEHTRLVGGAPEPLYLPAAETGSLHTLYYREDFFASALHEVAHWCIAGPRRRQLRDFGYWYAPDGRSPGQQKAFQAVEVRPQAIEWCFSQACAVPFRVSLDNLEAGAAARASEARFCRAVQARAKQFRESGLPPRAARFFQALAAEFGTGLALGELDLSRPAPV